MNAVRASSLFLLLPLVLAGLGCASTSLSSREAFLRAHPADREKYLKFWEVSPEALLRASHENYSARRALVRSLKKDFGKYPDLIKRLDAVDSWLVESAKHEQQYFQQVQAEFDPKQDTFFFYVRLNGKDEEDAYIIVRNTQIRKKDVIGTGEWLLTE